LPPAHFTAQRLLASTPCLPDRIVIGQPGLEDAQAFARLPMMREPDTCSGMMVRLVRREEQPQTWI
ncbi:MAG: hypothetical protein AVDCRST_MAG93-6633, partial [uncultured Chloroflexia bacterium]